MLRHILSYLLSRKLPIVQFIVIWAPYRIAKDPFAETLSYICFFLRVIFQVEIPYLLEEHKGGGLGLESLLALLL